MRKVVSLIILCVILFTLTGCTTGENEKSSNNENLINTENVATTSQNETEKNTTNVNNVQNETTNEQEVNYEQAAKAQMAKPEKGDTIAIMTVKDFGTIKFKFFEDIAPKAVENFTTHAKNGYYDGLTFHRVINEFMIQGGDPTGTGTGGESIWGEGFGTELDLSLVPYRGSLCMAMSSLPNSIGSQFFITQSNYDEELATLLKDYNYPEDLIAQYKNYGGYLSLYMNYTVFGQAYEGLDVLDEIAKVKTESVPMVIDGQTVGTQDDKPVEDVIIEKIEITTY